MLILDFMTFPFFERMALLLLVCFRFAMHRYTGPSGEGWFFAYKPENFRTLTLNSTYPSSLTSSLKVKLKQVGFSKNIAYP